MDEDPGICRLCLKVAERNNSFTPLKNNHSILQSLNLITFSTIKNLQLTENPVICEICNDKVKELAVFKENIITNEFKIQCNQKKDINSFLESISSDFERICRLCLKTSENSNEFQKTWKDNKKLFNKCNIHLNLNIPKPSKICLRCDNILQDMEKFVVDCSKNESYIVSHSTKKGLLNSKDLRDIIVSKSNKEVDDDKKVAEEDNNNFLLNKKKTTQVYSRIKLRSSSRKSKVINDEDLSQPKEFNNSFATDEISFIRKPEKTYGKVNLKSSIQTSITNMLDENERAKLLEEMGKEINKSTQNIDVEVPDVATVTLTAEEEYNPKDNGVQEWRDIIEVTEDMCDDLINDNNEINDGKVIVMEIETESSTSGIAEATEGEIANECVSEDNIILRIEKSDMKVPKNKEETVNNKHIEVSSGEDLTKPKSSQPATKAKRPKRNTSQSKLNLQKAVEGRKRSLRQKTIIVSFKEMENKKLQKNKEAENLEGSEEVKSTKTILVGRKRGNKSKEKNIPKKKPRKTKKNSKESSVVSEEIDDPNPQNNNETSETTLNSKKQGKRKANTANSENDEMSNNKHNEPVLETPEQVSADPILLKQEASSSYIQEETEDVSKGTSVKPYRVKIIRRKRKAANKADLDRTWQQLTGVPVNQDKELDVVVPKKRGRKPNPNKVVAAKPVYLKCACCSFKTHSQNSLIQHLYIHNVLKDMGQLKCSSCPFQTTSQEALTQHQAVHVINNLTYKCIFCEYLNKKKISIMNHILRHDDKDVASMFYCHIINEDSSDEYFECFQCDFQSSDEVVMPDHVIDHNRAVRIKNPIVAKFFCNKCSYKTKTEERLLRHRNLRHGVKKNHKSEKHIKTEPEDDDNTVSSENANIIFKCELCDYMTLHKRSLANHRTMKHFRKPPVKKDTGEVYYCAECSYTTHRKVNLTRHALVHKTSENFEIFECPHCYFETKHRRSYTRHMEIRHEVIV